MTRLRCVRPILLPLALLAACGGSSKGDLPGPGPQQPGPNPQPQPGPVSPGAPASPPVTVAAKLTAAQQAEVDRLQALLSANAKLTAEQLLEKRAVPFRALGYDARAARHLDLIQASQLKLVETELAGLGKNGFVISDRHRYPHFAYGYKAIYGQDLPVFISADSILQAVHQSYGAILKTIEAKLLLPQLETLLSDMSARIPSASDLPADVRRDADLFLTVAVSLLRGSVARSPANLAPDSVKQLFDLAQAGSGSQELVLLGAKRELDFSQFKPRGHYVDSPELGRYFKAMMWLGRVDLPFLQTDSVTGERKLIRQCVAAALGLRRLMAAEDLARWRTIDATVRGFVGEPDSLAPPEVDRLRTDLGLAADRYTLDGISDEALTAAIVAGAYGKQKILSQIVMQRPHDKTWPLDATFLFFGQRYVFDSHVLSSVVYDRVIPAAADVPRRMLPNPLDAAYAALANDQAAALLGGELRQYRYAGHLESIRSLGDEHGPEFWQANLYNLWLGALRSLSPGTELRDPRSGLPAVAATEAWGRRLLNTQLASWSQLRHDTILYAKQSYSGGVACEFPDAYVDPYPGFFSQIEKLAGAGANLAAALPADLDPAISSRVAAYWKRLGEVAAILRQMAEHQRTGTPHRPEHLAFINKVVNVGATCGGPASIEGWYADLFFDNAEAARFDATIADVHTAPTDAAGTRVGHVLHVGTGYPRLMVLTVNTCSGPKAYAGVVSTYHEVLTRDLERLTDAEWSRRFTFGQIPPDVDWMQDLVAR